MDLKVKIETALRHHFQVDHIQHVDEDGVHGFVGSPDFRGLSTDDRQARVGQALRNRAAKRTRGEQRRVVLIAAFTPNEYAPIGSDRKQEGAVRAHVGNGVCESSSDLFSKVDRILRAPFRIDHLDLVVDHGIRGDLLSPDFDDSSITVRVDLLDRISRDPDSGLSDRERRQISIMPCTPDGYPAKLERNSLG